MNTDDTIPVEDRDLVLALGRAFSHGWTAWPSVVEIVMGGGTVASAVAEMHSLALASEEADDCGSWTDPGLGPQASHVTGGRRYAWTVRDGLAVVDVQRPNGIAVRVTFWRSRAGMVASVDVRGIAEGRHIDVALDVVRRVAGEEEARRAVRLLDAERVEALAAHTAKAAVEAVRLDRYYPGAAAQAAAWADYVASIAA
jgi:hypothetical protein